MKWKIHKENSEDLGFAISCFLTGQLPQMNLRNGLRLC